MKALPMDRRQGARRRLPWRTVRLAVVLPVLFLSPGAVAANGAPEPGIPAVSVVLARTGEIASTIRVAGTLVPLHEVAVTVDLDGGARVTEILAEAGDEVLQGQALARLDDATIRIELDANAARLERAEAAIAQARSQIADATVAEKEARSSLERGRRLAQRDVIASAALEQLTYAAERAASTLDIQRQSLRLAEADRAILLAERLEIETRLERTTVRAPVAGRILRRSARVGAFVGSDSADLFVIAEAGSIEVEAQVPQMDFLRIPEGAPVEISVPGTATTFAGRVRLIEPAMQAAGRHGVVRIAVDAGAGLPTGAFVRGAVDAGRRHAILLPASAIQSVDGRPLVQVVEDGVVQSRAVTTGLRSGDLVEIMSGIGAGEAVVLRAGSFLGHGDRVHPVDVSHAAPHPGDRLPGPAPEGRP